MDVKSTWIPTWHQMDYVSWSLGLFSETTSWRKALHKTGRPWHFECSKPLIYSILSCVTTRMNRNSLNQHSVEGPVTYDFTLHLRVVTTLQGFGGVLGRPSDTFLGGLSQLHGHGSWLVCEVILNTGSPRTSLCNMAHNQASQLVGVRQSNIRGHDFVRQKNGSLTPTQAIWLAIWLAGCGWPACV